MSLETLTLEAAKLAENKRVQCCNFTLRPMSYEVYKPEGGELLVIFFLRKENKAFEFAVASYFFFGLI